MADENIVWGFYGYETPAGGQDIQGWFDGLPDPARDEALDTLSYLQSLPRHLWQAPHFEAFDPELSEIKFKVGALKKWYRIYGTFFGPANHRYSYTFLLGKEKKVKNDKLGKREARNRLRMLLRGDGKIHAFKFNQEFNS